MTGERTALSTGVLTLATHLRAVREALQVRNTRASREVQDAVTTIGEELARIADRLTVATRAPDDVEAVRIALADAEDRMALLEPTLRTALAGAKDNASFLGDVARVYLGLERVPRANEMRASTSARQLQRRLASLLAP